MTSRQPYWCENEVKVLARSRVLLSHCFKGISLRFKIITVIKNNLNWHGAEELAIYIAQPCSHPAFLDG